MLRLFLLITGLAGIVFAGLHVEWRRHRQALASIPIRIHVNGSRGKSSTTRLIAAALRSNGIRTVAKTTGTAARLILPDGSEEPVPRDGPANIGELTWALLRAAEFRAQAIVFECMAVTPDLQWTAENRIVRPTMTVVTNARLDHTDVQGASTREIAAGFAVRSGGTLVTTDPDVADILRPRVLATGGFVHLADASAVSPADLARMRHIEVPDNVALAFEVGRILGITRDRVLRGISAADPDPGVAFVADLPHRNGSWTLVNLFAANDPESTFRSLDGVEAAFGTLGRPILLFAARSDRTARSAEFAHALAQHARRFSKIVVWGQRTEAVVRRALRHGIDPALVVDAGRASPEALTDLLAAEMRDGRVVVGVGNIVGPAQRWLAHLSGLIESDRPEGVMA
jgi:gamma-polyglutamate synthase